MGNLKIAIIEGSINFVRDEEDLQDQVNEFCDLYEVVSVDVKQSWNRGFYIATIQYIDKGE